MDTVNDIQPWRWFTHYNNEDESAYGQTAFTTRWTDIVRSTSITKPGQCRKQVALAYLSAGCGVGDWGRQSRPVPFRELYTAVVPMESSIDLNAGSLGQRSFQRRDQLCWRCHAAQNWKLRYWTGQRWVSTMTLLSLKNQIAKPSQKSLVCISQYNHLASNK